MAGINMVHLAGTVKRDAKEGKGVLDFALEVENADNRYDIFDCRLTTNSKAWEVLDGFVTEGEYISVTGHLIKKTYTESQRMSGAWVDVRNTVTIVYVDDAMTEDDDE